MEELSDSKYHTSHTSDPELRLCLLKTLFASFLDVLLIIFLSQ